MTAPMRALGAATEDYLKEIYAHGEWHHGPVTTTGLASRLGLAASSVTEMVAKLDRAGLVTKVPYGGVTLTAGGLGLALRMTRRHRLIETWLVVEFGFRWDEVHSEAEVLEHAISDRMLELIDARLGRPRRDPHGDPIPDSAGAVVSETGIPVLHAPVGCRGVILRVSDRVPGLLRLLADHGVGLDSAVTVSGGAGGGAAARGVTVSGTEVDLALDAVSAASVLIVPRMNRVAVSSLRPGDSVDPS